MQIRPIQQSQNSNYKSNNLTNFKGSINCKELNRIFAETPVKIQQKYNSKAIDAKQFERLTKSFQELYTSIIAHLGKLNQYTELKTAERSTGSRVAFLENAYSEYIEPLNFRFAVKSKDEKINELHRSCGFDIVNETPEENIKIMASLEYCLEQLDSHTVEAKMVLHSNEPSKIQDAIKINYKDKVLSNKARCKD